MTVVFSLETFEEAFSTSVVEENSSRSSVLLLHSTLDSDLAGTFSGILGISFVVSVSSSAKTFT